MHLVIDVPEKNFVKNLEEKNIQTYQENGQPMSPFFSLFDGQVEKISNFFNSEIKNYESIFLRDLNKSAIQPNTSELELNENPSSIQFRQPSDKNLFISTCNDKNLKEAEYSNLSYKAKNDYFSYCINSFENMQNKFNFNYTNNLAQSQSPINISIKNNFDLKAYLDNFKENIQIDYVNNNNQNNEKYENYKYRGSYENNHKNKFFNETAEEICIKTNTNSNQNLYFCNKMLKKDFNNCNSNENYFCNKSNNNNNSKFVKCDLQTISDFKAHSIQDIFKYLNLNFKNDSNNNANYKSHFNNENLNNMINSYFHDNAINSKLNDSENIESPICFSRSNLNDYNTYFFGNANQTKISNLNVGSCNGDLKKAEFWARSQMQPIKSRGSSENQNCPSTAPFSKLSEDMKFLGKKTKNPSDDVIVTLETKKLRMLKIKNETKIFNNLLSKGNNEDANSNQKTVIAAAEADSAKPNSLESLGKRKALKNNKLVYVLKNNRIFQNPSHCPQKNSVRENKNNSVNNENESESKASIVNCKINEEEKGFLNLHSNKEASTVDFVENNSQLEKKDESSNEFTKTKSKRSSKFRGVSKNGNQWQVLIMINKKKMYIGSFASEEEAAKNYDYVALKNHGSKAKTNFFYAEEQILSLLKE